MAMVEILTANKRACKGVHHWDNCGPLALEKASERDLKINFAVVGDMDKIFYQSANNFVSQYRYLSE